MERLTKIDHRTMRTYWFAAAFVILIASLGATTIIYRDYTNRIDSAGQQVMSLAQALAEYTTQVFAKLDALSRAVMEDRADRIVHEGLLSEVMRRRAAAEPAAMGIAIVDRTGRVYASGMDEYPIGRDLSRTVDFEVLSRLGAADFYISKPYKSDLSVPGDFSGWAMSYARRISDSNGNFHGYVLIIVDEAYLNGFYSQLDHQPGMVFGLMGTDGTIRASSSPAVVGQNVASFIPEQLAAGKGIRINPSVKTGMERIFAYYRSSAAPLVAYVGLPTEPIYKAWLTASSVIVAALVALFAALGVLGVILGKYMRNKSSLMNVMIEAAHQRREKEFLETIVNTGGVLMAVTDVAGRFIVANQAMHELFPETEMSKLEEGAISQPLGEKLSVVTDNLPWQAVKNIVLADGRKRAISWSVSPITTSDGTIKNLVAVGLDITERRDAELSIYQAGKLVTLGEVATGIAHEINQPLATLAMAVDNLHARVSGGNLDQTMIVDGLDIASKQIDRAANIVRHMRIYGHRSDGSLRAVDPAEAIEGVLTIAGTQIENQGILIRKDYRAGDYRMMADLVLIEQIVLNLLLNARDAILENRLHNDTLKDKSGDDFIAISVEKSVDNMIAIVVEDSGPGIPAANLDRLFEPFFTTKPVGKGTGLGLSLSYGMARDMGGRLEASNGAEGAEFRLILRVAKHDEGEGSRE
ncbi:ATP-binding protein [Ochrobactrum sp. AN78]|uniref:ATP-binding protein n=1 Tax=Ochrobactrum sp. AN78 TaxID=3039853 RepID=UPI002989DD16|nr:ATP-binding protein [Ochrobactrum sp. AN78]MDH7790477.1 signal transduction histidine kinase [Ochrobactrum sp. AN78]